MSSQHSLWLLQQSNACDMPNKYSVFVSQLRYNCCATATVQLLWSAFSVEDGPGVATAATTATDLLSGEGVAEDGPAVATVVTAASNLRSGRVSPVAKTVPCKICGEAAKDPVCTECKHDTCESCRLTCVYYTWQFCVECHVQHFSNCPWKDLLVENKRLSACWKNNVP